MVTIIIILIIILFFILNYKVLLVENFNNKEIIFYIKNNLYNILKNDNDNYFKSFYNNDFKVRNISNINEYYTILYQSLCDPDTTTIRKVTNCISKIKLKIENTKLRTFKGVDIKKFLNLKWKIGFICSNKYENGLPHTRDDIIILNKDKIKMYNELKIMKTLIHEQVHVYQKKYKEDMKKYIINNKFTKIKKRTQFDNIRANPDLDDYIYQDQYFNTYKAVYNKNPYSIEDITYYPQNEQFYEHPNERMAIEFESILVN